MPNIGDLLLEDQSKEDAVIKELEQELMNKVKEKKDRLTTGMLREDDKGQYKYVYIIERVDSFKDSPVLRRVNICAYESMDEANIAAVKMKQEYELYGSNVDFLVWPLKVYVSKNIKLTTKS